MADFETRVRVTAQAQGFEKLPQEAAKLAAAQKGLTQGFQTATKAATAFQTTVDKALKAFSTKKAQTEVEGLTDIIKDLEEQLSDTAGKQLQLQKAMLETEKGSEVYKQLAAEMKRLDTQSAQVQKTIGLVTRAFKDQVRATKEASEAARQARGAFAQGFIQGAGMGEYFPRGPGMWRQAAGRMAGRAMIGVPGGVGRGLAATPFAGAAGMAQALQAIPFAGALAGPLQTAMGFTQRAMGYEQQRLQLAPFLLGPGGLAESRRGAARAAAAGLTPADIERRAKEAGARAAATEDFGTPTFTWEKGKGFAVESPALADLPALGPNAPLSMRQQQAREIIERGYSKDPMMRGKILVDAPALKTRDREAEARAAEAAERRKLRAQRERIAPDLLGGVRRAGWELGAMGAPEALQFAGTMAQRGGGGLADLRRTGMLRAGMAAQTAFGVGPEVTGMLQLGARRGGVVGGMGGERLTQMIGDAMALGLRGSEITDYMETMAQGIEQWRQTGIPLNPTSIREVSGAFAATGLGVVQGRRVAAGVQARAGAIATGGPQSAIDMILMQALGGFRGGGIGEFQAARKRMAAGEFGGEEIQNLMRTLTTATGGGAAGEAALQAAMGQLGITMTPQMAGQLLAVGRGGPVTPEQQKAMAQFQEEARAGAGMAPKGEAGMEAMARDIIKAMGPNLKRQADIQNQQLAVGQKLAPAMLSFEQATTSAASSFGELAPQITKIATAAADLAALLPKAAARLNAWIEGGSIIGVP